MQPAAFTSSAAAAPIPARPGKPAYSRENFLAAYYAFCQATERLYQVNAGRNQHSSAELSCTVNSSVKAACLPQSVSCGASACKYVLLARHITEGSVTTCLVTGGADDTQVASGHLPGELQADVAMTAMLAMIASCAMMPVMQSATVLLLTR
jgi:hypothetical protein